MQLASLYVHPLKSARGVRHTRAFTGQAGLQGDRSWMLTTPEGQFITARSHPRLTQVRVTPIPGALLLQAPGQPLRAAISAVYTRQVATEVWGNAFTAWHGDTLVDAWFSQYLGTECALVRMAPAAQRPTSTKWTRGEAAFTQFSDGYPVLVISQDLDEIFEVATEIAVVSDGRLSKAYPAQDMTREKIGLLMGGMYGKTEGEGAAHAH